MSETVRLIDELNSDDGLWVEDRHYIDKLIEGPQVLHANDCNFMDSTFIHGGTVESILIELDGDHDWCGVLGIRRCEFVACTFTKIAFAGTAEQLEVFREIGRESA